MWIGSAYSWITYHYIKEYKLYKKSEELQQYPFDHLGFSLTYAAGTVLGPILIITNYCQNKKDEQN